MTIIAILQIPLLLALLAIRGSRRRNRVTATERAEQAARMDAAELAPVTCDDDGLDSFMSMRRLGRSTYTEQTPTTVHIARQRHAHAALEVLWVGGTVLVDLTVSEIVAARAWSQGKLAFALGETRRDYGTWLPLDNADAGWEMYVVTTSGRMLHLQGAPGIGVDAELTRLAGRIRVAKLAPVA